jgi:predicted TIM-barrel fold metal-dependent hydrolase
MTIGRGIIDIVVNLKTARIFAEGRLPTDAAFQAKTNQSEAARQGVELEQYVATMDAAGIERSLLIAARCGDMRMRGSIEIPYDYVHEACQAFPHRFSGVAGIDPTRGMKGLSELEYAVRELGFVAAHWYPHWFGMAPDRPQIYPYYAKCCELGIPMMLQVGHNLVYQTDRRLPSVGRPITLDQVAIDFPELKIIGIHLGVPWTDEMISMAYKHENIYIGGDAYAPRYWPPQMVHFANTYGRRKFIFGTDWPVVDPVKAVQQVDDLGFRPESWRRIMRENALEVFRLPGHDAG